MVRRDLTKFLKILRLNNNFFTNKDNISRKGFEKMGVGRVIKAERFLETIRKHYEPNIKEVTRAGIN